MASAFRLAVRFGPEREGSFVRWSNRGICRKRPCSWDWSTHHA